jgi:hypothetical protein
MWSSSARKSALSTIFGGGDPTRQLRCFCCFCRKLAAIDIAFAAEILEFRRLDHEKNSG